MNPTISRATAAFVAALAVASCAATRADVTRYVAPRTAVPTDSVEIFTDRTPDRPHVELGVIEVVGNAVAGWGDLILRARAEAAKLGADAMIIRRQPTGVATAVALDAETVIASQQDVPRVWAVAVVWRDG